MREHKCLLCEMIGGEKPRATGKAFELQIAKMLKGKRSGYGNLDKPDVESPCFDVECKVMPLPAKLESALQTIKSKGNPMKLQFVVLKTKGTGINDARIYLALTDFLDWYG